MSTIGDGLAVTEMLSRGEARLDGPEAFELDPMELSRFLFVRGNRQVASGDLTSATVTFNRLSALHKARGDTHQQAIARGKIADILQVRGELDEALRLYQEEALPVFERLGLAGEKAVTLDRIAALLKAGT